MQISALPPAALHLDKPPGIDLLRPTSLVLQSSWNPTSVHNDGCSLDEYGVFFFEQVLEGDLTPFVAIERVEHIKALSLDSVYDLGPGDEHLLGLVQLAQYVVGLESVIGVKLLIRHPPPSEVELLPGSDVCDLCGEAIVALRPVEVLLDVLSVVPVGEAPREDEGGGSSISH